MRALFALIPWWVKVAIAAAVMAAIYFAWEHYIANPYREQGAAPVRAEFTAYKVAQDKQRAEIILDYVDKLGKAHDDKVRADAAADKRLAILGITVGNVVNTPRGVVLGRQLERVLDAGSTAANGRLAAPDRSGQASADAVPATPEAAAGVYDESELAVYFAAGPRAYDDAVGLWQSCRAREDACRDAHAKGITP